MEATPSTSGFVRPEGHSSDSFPPSLFSAYALLWNSEFDASVKELQHDVDILRLKRKELNDTKVKGGGGGGGGGVREGKDGKAVRGLIWVLSALTEVYFWQYVHNETDQYRERLEVILEEMLKEATALYEENKPSSGFISFFTADVSPELEEAHFALYQEGAVALSFYYLAYSLFLFRRQNHVRGAFNFRKSWTYFAESRKTLTVQKEKGYAIVPMMEGLIAFGHGLFHFIISLIPPSLRTLATIIGFEADRENAYIELQRCVNSGCLKSNEAALVLFGLRKYFLEEQEKAHETLKLMETVYPRSVLVIYASAFMHRFDGKLENSIGLWKRLLDIVDFSPQMQGTTRYQMGYCYFLLQDWAKAASAHEDFLKVPLGETGPRFRPYTAIQLGFSYYMLGREEEVESLFQRIPEWFRENQSYDSFALSMSKRWLSKKRFDAAEALVFLCATCLEARQFNQTLTVATALSKYIESRGRDYPQEILPVGGSRVYDESQHQSYDAALLYHRGAALAGLGEFQGATECLKNVAALESSISREDKHLIPYSYAVLAEVAMEINTTESLAQADFYISRAKAFKKFDWEKILSFRLYSNRFKLERKRLQLQTSK